MKPNFDAEITPEQFFLGQEAIQVLSKGDLAGCRPRETGLRIKVCYLVHRRKIGARKRAMMLYSDQIFDIMRVGL